MTRDAKHRFARGKEFNLYFAFYGTFRDEDTKWLEWIEKKFKEIAGADGQIDLDEFKKALGVKRVNLMLFKNVLNFVSRPVDQRQKTLQNLETAPVAESIFNIF